MRAILHHPESTRLIQKDPDGPKPDRPLTRRKSAAPLTIACDITFLLFAIGAGLVLQGLAGASWPISGYPAERQLLEAVLFWSVTTMAVWFLLVDAGRCLWSSRLLPFDWTEQVVKQTYGRRLEVIWWAIATSLVLLCLCLLLPAQPLFSKMFLASVIALIALAVRKSIPAQKLAFAASTGVFSFAMLVMTVAGAFVR